MGCDNRDLRGLLIKGKLELIQLSKDLHPTELLRRGKDWNKASIKNLF